MDASLCKDWKHKIGQVFVSISQLSVIPWLCSPLPDEAQAFVEVASSSDVTKCPPLLILLIGGGGCCHYFVCMPVFLCMLVEGRGPPLWSSGAIHLVLCDLVSHFSTEFVQLGYLLASVLEESRCFCPAQHGLEAHCWAWLFNVVLGPHAQCWAS